jgi:hypothetical protein
MRIRLHFEICICDEGILEKVISKGDDRRGWFLEEVKTSVGSRSISKEWMQPADPAIVPDKELVNEREGER